MSEPPAPDRYAQPPHAFEGKDVIDEHALALGKLCIWWSTMDRTLADVVGLYLGVDETLTSCALPAETSTRCEMIRRLAFATGPDGEWRECMVRLVNRVQTEMAEQRNRYVHDDWSVSDAGMVRIDRRAKIKRPQSRKPPELVIEVERVVPVEWVQDLTEQVVDMMVALTIMGQDLTVWRKTKQTRPPAPLAVQASNYRSQEGRLPPAPLRWKRPLESSRE